MAGGGPRVPPAVVWLRLAVLGLYDDHAGAGIRAVVRGPLDTVVDVNRENGLRVDIVERTEVGDPDAVEQDRGRVIEEQAGTAAPPELCGPAVPVLSSLKHRGALLQYLPGGTSAGLFDLLRGDQEGSRGDSGGRVLMQPGSTADERGDERCAERLHWCLVVRGQGPSLL